MFEKRAGETLLDVDPADMPKDAGIVFIGKINSPWKSRSNCPKNMRQARERNQAATVEVFQQFRPGLNGLAAGDPVILLSWLGHAPRNLIVQKPKHADHPKGTFSLRSPARPNPVGLHVVQLLEIDGDNGTLILDAIDVLDGTAVVDIKPWFATTEIIGGGED